MTVVVAVVVVGPISAIIRVIIGPVEMGSVIIRTIVRVIVPRIAVVIARAIIRRHPNGNVEMNVCLSLLRRENDQS